MRHRKSGRQLNRNSSHRKAMFRNMAASLFEHELIKTTLPKAKELKPKIDKVITLGKTKSLQSKKNLFSQLQDKNSVDKLLKTLSQRYEKRKGGYSRLIRAGFRYGDDAPMAIIELIDRDVQAKKVDIKVKSKESTKEALPPKTKEPEKKAKTKK